METRAESAFQRYASAGLATQSVLGIDIDMEKEDVSRKWVELPGTGVLEAQESVSHGPGPELEDAELPAACRRLFYAAVAFPEQLELTHR